MGRRGPAEAGSGDQFGDRTPPDEQISHSPPRHGFRRGRSIGGVEGFKQ